MQRSEYASKQNNKTTSKMYCAGILAMYITRSVQDLRLPPRVEQHVGSLQFFFIVAANRLTWTLSVVSPSVERQFSISYMTRQAAVQLFINASILVLKTSVSQGRQRFVLKWCRFVMIISRSASGGEFVQRQLWYHWLQKYSNTSHRSEIQLCSLTLECSLISNKMFVRHASCFT